jgi:hypothetical protein
MYQSPDLPGIQWWMKTQSIDRKQRCHNHLRVRWATMLGRLHGRYAAVPVSLQHVRSRMQTLYRYLKADRAESFVQEGSLLLRSLSFYRDYEDAGVRADPFEGTLAHRPQDGLKATMVESGEVRSLPYTFESTAREDDIFVYCMSAELNPVIAKKFETAVWRVSGILCARHIMTMRSMYAKQENHEVGRGPSGADASHSERAH